MASRNRDATAKLRERDPMSPIGKAMSCSPQDVPLLSKNRLMKSGCIFIQERNIVQEKEPKSCWNLHSCLGLQIQLHECFSWNSYKIIVVLTPLHTMEAEERKQRNKTTVRKRHPVGEDIFNPLTLPNMLLNQLIATHHRTLCSLWFPQQQHPHSIDRTVIPTPT